MQAIVQAKCASRGEGVREDEEELKEGRGTSKKRKWDDHRLCVRYYGRTTVEGCLMEEYVCLMEEYLFYMSLLHWYK